MTITKGTRDADALVNALKLLLFISRFIGLAPLAFLSEDISPSRCMAVWGYICLVCFDIVAGVTVIFQIQGVGEKPKHSRITTSIWYMNIVMSVLVFNIAVCRATSRMRRLKYILMISNKIKRNLRVKNVSNIFRYKYCIYIAIMLPIVWTVMTFESLLYAKRSNFTSTAFLFFPITIVSETVLLLIQLQYVLTSLLVRTALHNINDCLTRMLADLQGGKSTMIEDRMHAITNSYIETCRLVRQVNSSHGIVLLLIFILLCKNLAICLYHFLESIQNDITQEKMLIFYQGLLCVYFSIQVMLLVEPSHQTKEEIQTISIMTGKIICEILQPDKPYDPLPTQLDIFLKVLDLNQPSQASLGLNLERSLIAMVFGGVTSSVIFISQFN